MEAPPPLHLGFFLLSPSPPPSSSFFYHLLLPSTSFLFFFLVPPPHPSKLATWLGRGQLPAAAAGGGRV